MNKLQLKTKIQRNELSLDVHRPTKGENKKRDRNREGQSKDQLKKKSQVQQKKLLLQMKRWNTMRAASNILR